MPPRTESPYTPVEYNAGTRKNPAGSGRSDRDVMQSWGGLSQTGGDAGAFANLSQGNFRGLGRESLDVRNQLRRQAMGADSISAEQLRQGLQQNQAMQSSMAAGARGGNQAMAALTAQNNASRMGSGLAGQQAIAGIAERSAANQSLGNMISQQRQLELQAALGARGQQLDAYGRQIGSEDARYAADRGVPVNKESSYWDKGLQAAGTVAAIYAMSDRRLKTEIKDGGKDADEFVAGLRAHLFKYKDPKHGGSEEHLGIMAQDLEKTRYGRQAVVETKDGKAVHGARLATQLAAGLGRLGERLSALESKK